MPPRAQGKLGLPEERDSSRRQNDDSDWRRCSQAAMHLGGATPRWETEHVSEMATTCRDAKHRPYHIVAMQVRRMGQIIFGAAGPIARRARRICFRASGCGLKQSSAPK